jgi:Fur family transcriptional regulator, ferric uptake regulator
MSATRLELPVRSRRTPQREAVLEVIQGQKGNFTAVEVYDRARRTAPRLGLATVYRTIDLLRRNGTVRRLPGDEPTYIRCRPGHHHHLVCLSCGSVEETELCAAPAPAELKKKHGFEIEGHELDIYGTCARCA